MTNTNAPFDPKADPDAEYTIHALLPTGLTVASWVGGVRGDVMAGVVPITIPFGGELLVTKANGLREANRDRNGVSWLEFTEDEQRAEYKGKLRFGFGPTPPRIVAEVAAARREELLEQRRRLLANSHAASRFAAERSFLASLDAELEALDVESQGAR